MEVMRNLIKNNIRLLLKNKLQLILLLLLSAILGFLFTYLYYGNVPIQNSYKEDLKATKVEEFRILPKANIAELEDKYDFSAELFRRKYVQEGQNTFYISVPMTNINKYYVVEGKDDIQGSNILLSLQFAKKNNIKINDKIVISNSDYTVSGLYYQPSESLIFNSQYASTVSTTKNAGVLMNKDNFESLSGNEDKIYVARFNKNLDKTEFDSKIKDMMNDDDISLVESSKNLQSFNTLLSNFQTSLSLMKIGFILFVLVIVIVVMLLVRNQFQYSRRCSGVLMAIGYKRVTIALPFVLIQIPILIGMTIGAFLGLFMSESFLVNYFNVFNIVHPVIRFNYLLIVGVIITVNITIAIITFLLGLKLLRINELNLIYDRDKHQVGKITVFSKKLLEHFPFQYKIRYAFLLRKLWRFSIIVFISLIAFFMINFAAAIFNLTLEPIKQMDDQMKFKSMIIYNDIKNEPSKENRRNTFLNYRFYIESAETDAGKKNIEKKYDVQFVHAENDMLKLSTDNKSNPLLNMKKNDVIISKKLAYDYNLKEGDILNIKDSKGDIQKFNISAINITVYDSLLYLNADYMQDMDSVLHEGDYNGQYSSILQEKTEEMKVVISKEQQKEQTMTLLKGSLSLIPMMLVITIVLVVSLTSLISYFNINDAKKDITILNILGYQNKVISKMVINIYSVAIFIGSIICSLFIDKIFESIQTYVNKSTEILIILQTNTVWKIASFIIVYIVYKISIFIMKRNLNKIEIKNVLYAE